MMSTNSDYIATLTAFNLTLLVIFQDCGEVLSTFLGWTLAWTGHAITFQLFANIVIQTMIVKKPDFLESGIFENNIKWVVTLVIPLLTIIMYILTYFIGG